MHPPGKLNDAGRGPTQFSLLRGLQQVASEVPPVTLVVGLVPGSDSSAVSSRTSLAVASAARCSQVG